jgi:hypothetical protein
MTQVVVNVIPGKHPTASLYHSEEHLGDIVILRPNNILVEDKNGRKDRFGSIETCARFCGIPMSEKIELEWR